MEEYCKEYYSNVSLSDNWSVHHEPYPLDHTIWKDIDVADSLKIFAYAVVIVGGLLGNVSVILTVSLNRSMRTTINYYVANLAVADAMICIICMLPHALNVVTNQDIYVLGEFMCKFNPFTQMACLTSSVLTLSAISCDRFMAIMFPLRVRVTKQRTSVVMTLVWLVSGAVSVPFLLFKKHMVIEWKDFVEPKCTEEWPVTYYVDGAGECQVYETLRAPYYLVVSVTLFFLPMVIMVTTYSLILWRLWKTEVPGEQHAANVGVHSRAKKKVNKMVFTVLVVFIICWTPLQVMVLYAVYGHSASRDGALPSWFDHYKWFAHFIAYANSFMNPIIYGGFNKTFREGFCIVLRCGYSGGTYQRQGSNMLSKSLRTVSTTLSSLRSRTGKFFTKSNVKVPMYQAQLVRPTVV